jgi:DNA phosphorothioation system restriction enzyme
MYSTQKQLQHTQEPVEEDIFSTTPVSFKLKLISDNLSSWVFRNEPGYYETNCPGCPCLPQSLELRPYQREAIGNWFANNGRGTLKMATGSGKTITSLAIATELYKQINLQVILVVCPYRHLVTQWARECEKFNLKPLLAFDNVRNWHNRLSSQIYNLRAGNQKFVTIITTNSTLISENFQSQLRYLPDRTLIIGDEVHNLGAPALEENLPRRIGLRLGLSATPERHFDENGTQGIFDYFGNVLKPEFTLKDAINQGALVHYLYHPTLVELTETEALAYAKLTKRIGRILLAQQKQNEEVENIDSDRDITPLLVQRARLISTAENKLQALKEIMETRRHTNHTLFYCSDATLSPGDRSNLRQLKEVAKILGTDLGYRVNTYTANTSLQQRENLRRQFESGELQGLVAIRCLDEGVDIPAIETAVILASSGNPRQFIQRRGRVLRPHPGKERATIFDMIVLPPNLDRETFDIERNLLKKELKRFVEFADLADNAGQARMKLLELQKRYNLIDI